MRRLLLVPLLAALAGTALAQTFPPTPQSTKVFDGANLLSASEEQTIAALSRDFERDTGAPIVVATLASLDRYEAKTLGIQKYSTALFNEWRVGKRSANGGILLVVAKADRKVWVALGKDWGRGYDAKTQGIVRGTITPLFKQGRFGEGVVQGCRALARLADETPQSAAGAQAQDFAPEPNVGVPYDDLPSSGTPMQGDGSPFPGLGLACFAVPVVLFVLVAVGRRRRTLYGPRGGFGGGFAPGPGPNGVYRQDDVRYHDDRRDDSGDFLTGLIVGQAMSQPPVYDPSPFDNGPFDESAGFDSGPSYDSGSGSDSSSDSGGSFDSGSSDGGGGGGDW